MKTSYRVILFFLIINVQNLLAQQGNQVTTKETNSTIIKYLNDEKISITLPKYNVHSCKFKKLLKLVISSAKKQIPAKVSSNDFYFIVIIAYDTKDAKYDLTILTGHKKDIIPNALNSYPIGFFSYKGYDFIIKCDDHISCQLPLFLKKSKKDKRPFIINITNDTDIYTFDGSCEWKIYCRKKEIWFGCQV